MKFFLNYGALIQSIDSQHKTPLYYAIHNQDEEIFSLLLDAEKDLERDITITGNRFFKKFTSLI